MQTKGRCRCAVPRRREYRLASASTAPSSGEPTGNQCDRPIQNFRWRCITQGLIHTFVSAPIFSPQMSSGPLASRRIWGTGGQSRRASRSTLRNRCQFWRSSRLLIRSGGKAATSSRTLALFFRIHRQEVAGPEHQPRRGLRTREKHGRALVADFRVRQRLAGFGVPEAQQQIEEITIGRLCRRRLALRDDFVNRRGQVLLKARAPAVGEGEGTFALRKPVDEGWPSRSFDVVARHMADFLAVAALRHGEQGPQDRLQSRVLEGFREIGPRRLFNRTRPK